MSVHANGTRAKALRLQRGWNREDLLLQTHFAVERLSKAEIDLGRRGRFTQRLKSKSRDGELAGLSKSTIYAVETGKRVSLATLQIVAETYGVQIRDLTLSTDLEREDADLLRALLTDHAELMAQLYALLDAMLREQREEDGTGCTDDEHDDAA
jgi:transcriptional regulator with XRE-family HTH domain